MASKETLIFFRGFLPFSRVFGLVKFHYIQTLSMWVFLLYPGNEFEVVLSININLTQLHLSC